jgi:hypothetical protein
MQVKTGWSSSLLDLFFWYIVTLQQANPVFAVQLTQWFLSAFFFVSGYLTCDSFLQEWTKGRAVCSKTLFGFVFTLCFSYGVLCSC